MMASELAEVLLATVEDEGDFPVFDALDHLVNCAFTDAYDGHIVIKLDSTEEYTNEDLGWT